MCGPTYFEATYCSNYFHNGQTFDFDSLFIDSFISYLGCSVISSTNYIKDTLTTDTNVYFCNTYQFNGYNIFNDTLIIDESLNINGCTHITSFLFDKLPLGDTIIFDTSYYCNSYEHLGTTYNSINQFTDTFDNIYGCDSVVKVNYIDNAPIGEVINYPSSIEALNTTVDDTIFWVNCFNQQIVPNENGLVFHPQAPGFYGMLIQNNGCSTLTNCYNIIPAPLNISNPLVDKLIVYPNPTYGEFYIKTPKETEYQLTVYTVDFKKIITSKKVKNSSVEPVIISLPIGVYYINIITDKDNLTRKLIKL